VRSSSSQLRAESSADVSYGPPAYSTPEWETPSRPNKTGMLAASVAVVAGLFLLILFIVVMRTKALEESRRTNPERPQPEPLSPIRFQPPPRWAPPEDNDPTPQGLKQPQVTQADQQDDKPTREPRQEEEGNEPEQIIRPRLPAPPLDPAPNGLENKPTEERAFSPRVRPVSLSKVMDKPANDYEASCQAARAKLLKGFDTAIDDLRKGNNPADEKLKWMDIVKKEKERFEKSELIPWSRPMRPHVDRYLDSLESAQKKFLGAYESLIDKELRARNDKVADRLRSEREKRLDVKVMAQWRHIENARG
jgi:cell division protein FtsN